MRDLYHNNPYLFWSFVFFFSFVAASFFSGSFRKLFSIKIDGGKIPKEMKLIFQALKDCHFSNDQEYLKSLRELAKNYPEEIDFFLMAGDVARKTNPAKALEIHRDLLFRSNTAGKVRGRVLSHVGEDYFLLGKYSKAINALKESLKTYDNSKTRMIIAKAYERVGDIGESVENMRKSIKISGTEDYKEMKDLIARGILNSFRKGNVQEMNRWIDELTVFSSDNEILLLNLKKAVSSDKEKKSASLLKEVIEKSPQFEIAARGFVSEAEWGRIVNNSVEGKYRKLFEGDLNSSVFLCSRCLNPLKPGDPVCDSCFNYSGKKICKYLEG